MGFGAPAGTATTSTGSEIMIVGDLRTGYAIVDRISTTMEIIQHLYGPTNRFPTGQRGAYAFLRTVANGLRLARSGISKSRELILVRGGVSFKEANVAVGHHMIWRRRFYLFLVCAVMAAPRSTSPRAFFGFMTDHFGASRIGGAGSLAIWSRVLISQRAAAYLILVSVDQA
jgi:hypothetical protein